MNNHIDKLAELFEAFPGIGKRQARRFVYFLLHKNNTYVNDLIQNISAVRQGISQCTECFRFYTRDANTICPTCMNSDGSMLLIVEKDADFETISKAKIYEGKYFILGGFINPNEKRRSYARTDALISRIKRDVDAGVLEEVIFGLSLSPEGEHTRLRLYNMLKESYPNLTFSTLGRGLSSGTELEYSDAETLTYALNARIKQ